VEREARLGGNHTWCFHGRDVTPTDRRWVEPLIVHRWPGYEVRFPRRTRRLASPYACATSERLHDVITARLAPPHCRLALNRSATELSASSVVLDDGEILQGAIVVDARGPKLSRDHPGLGARARGRASTQGFQKFLGLELAVDPPARIRREPVLMDACIPQRDGFRFMYLLPFERDRWLFEETFFSDNPGLDRDHATTRILRYAEEQGFRVHSVLREEQGVLPMPWQREPESTDTGSPLLAGYRGGFFHPVTGYSFPLSVRYARALAASHPTPRASGSALAAFSMQQREQQRFLFMLTGMMFRLFEPERRFEVLEHFYRLPESVIERFYAAELTPLDCARMFLGAPPRGLSWKRAFDWARSLPVEQNS
jgi:lycopene beta-cyclase